MGCILQIVHWCLVTKTVHFADILICICFKKYDELVQICNSLRNFTFGIAYEETWSLKWIVIYVSKGLVNN